MLQKRLIMQYIWQILTIVAAVIVILIFASQKEGVFDIIPALKPVFG
ncbi:MAG: hypothetical protein HYW26_03165 [Candidatus Aenigmarchaeota archaeon]|nr:hypothetical protein [Candidatus Aenigmarchaeota archaeon]